MTRKIDPRYEDFLFDKLCDSEHPEDLARYIEEGGEITDEMRLYLADLARERAPKTRGGANRKRDIDVYWEVEKWRRECALAQIIAKGGSNHSEKPDRNSETSNGQMKAASIETFEAIEDEVSKNLPTLQRAFQHFTSDEEDAEIKIWPYQKQYERGRQLLWGYTTSGHVSKNK